MVHIHTGEKNTLNKHSCKEARVEVPTWKCTDCSTVTLTPHTCNNTNTTEMNSQLTSPQISPWLHALLCVSERDP